GVEDMVVDGMVVPVADAPTQRAIERRGYQVNACLNQPARQQASLTPGVPTVTRAHALRLQSQVKCSACLWTGQNIPGLPLKGVEGTVRCQLIHLAAHLIQLPPQVHASVEASELFLVADTDIGDHELRVIRVAVDSERLVRRAKVRGAEVWN